MIRPLTSADSYRGAVFALVGFCFACLLTPVALLPAVPVHRVAGRGAQLTVVLLVFAVSVPACGFLAVFRTGCVRIANRLLRTALPVPGPEAPRPDRAARARAAGWLLAHVVAGWAVTAAALLLTLTGLLLVGSWLNGGDRVQVFGLPVTVAAGWSGAWTPPAAAAALMASAWCCRGLAAAFRTLGPVLLGPGKEERFAALEARLRAMEQRTELARELHDSIGHTLTAATIQAAVAAELIDADPHGARQALAHIEQSSRSALDDLDHVLGVLRTGAASTVPRRTLADLSGLLERVRSTGTEVHADLRGDWARVPAAVSREAYRLVQEGLTNALRHAHQAPVTVRVAVEDGRGAADGAAGDWLAVELSNPVTSSRGLRGQRPRPGQGLSGLTERVRLLHGELTAGPAPDGRWRLAARIPLRAAA
ncbi:two-component sensor histidine kinase [Streptomyces oryzae]|uniref:histidine kinase n=1 Tax=Streptomyces oryzae TaxID=1434886 RepID=A0ABS3XJE6_9ACTN|nr:two-component sensor histidine kinase [Streptomyces oryzae]